MNVYEKKIKNSSLIFTLRRVSHQIFSKWVENATQLYDLPPELIENVDNQEVEETFIKCLASAIKTLEEDVKAEKKRIPGWSFGYFCGFVQGKIDLNWFNKYVIEQSKEYENLVMIKSLIEYLRWDSEAVKKIFVLYNHFLKKKKQLTDSFDMNSIKIIPLSNHKGYERIQINEFKRDTIAYFSTDLERKYMELLDSKTEICCPDITDYLDNQQIQEFIGKNSFNR